MIHPEIKEFWNLKNDVSGPFGDRGPEYYVWYLREDKDPFAEIIAHEWKDGSKIEYFWRDNIYTESEMLRIVKLKFFL